MKILPILTFVLFAAPLFAQECVTIFETGVPATVRLNDSKMTQTENTTEFTAYGEKYAWPGPVIQGQWNVDGFQKILFEVENCDPVERTFHIRIDDASARQNGANWFTSRFTVPANEKMTFAMPIPCNFPPQLQGKVEGMRGLPGGLKSDGAQLDWKDVVGVYLFVSDLSSPAHFNITKIVAQKDKTASETFAQDTWMRMSPEEFFPMIDVYGQFRYADWPGKIHDDSDFAERIVAEKSDLANNPKPAMWDRFGGWANGPKLEATGRFRVQKLDGKWWFVDPDGHLFWSHGVDCVGTNNGVTPISFREHYFQNLPEKTTPFGAFYGTGSSHIGFYKDKGTFSTYNFTCANLYRKYGADFGKIHADLVHNRLGSWGMNTIANWSDANVYRLRRTPYVLTLYAGGRQIVGSQGYWGKFPDPFSEEFRNSLRQSLEQKKEFLRDPWCVGAFVNNEMSWGDDLSLSRAALASPAEQPAKVAFVAFLKEKYGTVEKLNDVWKTTYASWEAILQTSDAKETPEMKPDLGAFYSRIAEQYFRVVHEELRAADPGLLDMGCRFAWTNDRAAYAMAKFVDVMSYNRYQESVADFRLPAGIDLPCIIGEFHFGALDRGMFHTGLRGAKDQNERAEKYYTYVRGALENPLLVGTHWFQYGSQATTGRFDGENYQIGLVDLGDTPYPEMISKLRELGRTMYEIRRK